jgi:hypothetical protein
MVLRNGISRVQRATTIAFSAPEEISTEQTSMLKIKSVQGLFKISKAG